MYDPRGRTRASEPNSPNIQGRGEETPNISLVARVNLRDGAFDRRNLTLEPPRASVFIGLVVYTLCPKGATSHGS